MIPFETIVQNNLYYWLRNVSWSQAIDIPKLISERENIAKAIKKGVAQNKTFDLAVHLLCVSADVMMQIGGGRQWNLIAKQAANQSFAQKNDYTKGHLLLCQAKFLFTQERYEEALEHLCDSTPIAKVNQDVDLLWQIHYYEGLNCIRTAKLEQAEQSIQDIRDLLQHFTLLNAALCQGYLGLLGAELAIQKLDWDMVSYCLKDGIRHLTKSGAEHNLSKAYLLMGQYHFLQQSPKEALQAWLRALKLLPVGFDFANRSYLIVKCAALQLDAGAIKEAAQLLQQVDFSMLRLLEHHHIHLDAVLTYGRLVEAQGNTKQAQLIFDDAKVLQNEIRG